MRQIVLDTETTGLNLEEGHRIIEIGCIELINRKFTGKRFHHYINPARYIEEGALAVHGITNTFLQNKPYFHEIAEEFYAFITGAELIIHNAAFDTSFLQHELQSTQKNFPPLTKVCKIFDTLALAKKLHIGQRNNLDVLCKRYGIDNTHRDLHGALLDATLLAHVYLAMTGGQSSLFGEGLLNEGTTASIFTSQEKPQSVRRSLYIAKASGNDLHHHAALLKLIAEKTPCLWLKEEFAAHNLKNKEEVEENA